MKTKTWHYAALVFLGGCCFGILSTFVKLAYSAGFATAEVTGGQFLLGTFVIGVLALFSKKGKLSMLVCFKLVIAGIPMGLTGIFYYLSLQTLEASLAIIFLFQFIWIGAVLEWLLEKKKPTKIKLASIGILLSGSILASGVFFMESSFFSLKGVLWASLAAGMFALFIYISGTVGRSVPSIQKSFLLSLGGLIIVLIWMQPNFQLPMSSLIELSYYALILGVFGVALPPLLFSIGMPQIGAGLGTILSASELPVAVILSALVLRESVSWVQWLGVTIILAGIAVGNTKSRDIAMNLEKST